MRNYLYFIIITGLLITPVYAQATGISAETEIPTDVNQQNNNNKNPEKPAARQAAKTIKRNNWPATFVPSEKINADSSVAFPVDI